MVKNIENLRGKFAADPKKSQPVLISSKRDLPTGEAANARLKTVLENAGILDAVFLERTKVFSTSANEMQLDKIIGSGAADNIYFNAGAVGYRATRSL